MSEIKTIVKPSIDTIIKFIQKYREMEKSSYDYGYNLIYAIFDPHFSGSISSHLCDHWKSKKKGFAQWFLNLGTQKQILVLRAFDITDENDAEYFNKWKEDQLKRFWLKVPDTTASLNSLILFFNNNSIQQGTFAHYSIPTEGIKFPTNAKKRYGNSANWGDFVLENIKINPSPLLPFLDFAMQYK